MTISHLSASALKRFKNCPKSYYLRYMEKYESHQPSSNKYTKLGSSVHESIEETLQEYPSLRDQEQLLQVMQKKNKKTYPEEMEDQAQSCFKTASKYISGYVGDDIQAIEDRWTMDYRGIELIGYCDLVEGGKIIDWKTGKSDGKEMDEKIQASFYIKLYENEFGELPEQVDFAYIDEGTRSTHKRITDDGQVLWNNSKNVYWEDTEKIINQIINSDNNDEWEATPETGNCHWCEFNLHCADSPFGAEYVDRENIEIGL